MPMLGKNHDSCIYDACTKDPVSRQENVHSFVCMSLMSWHSLESMVGRGTWLDTAYLSVLNNKRLKKFVGRHAVAAVNKVCGFLQAGPIRWDAAWADGLRVVLVGRVVWDHPSSSSCSSSCCRWRNTVSLPISESSSGPHPPPPRSFSQRKNTNNGIHNRCIREGSFMKKIYFSLINVFF